MENSRSDTDRATKPKRRIRRNLIFIVNTTHPEKRYDVLENSVGDMIAGTNLQ